MFARLTIAALLLAVAGSAQAAGAYKWVDADGRSHYDDQNRLEQRLTLKYLNDRAIPGRQDATTPAAFVEAVAADCTTARDRADVFRSAAAIYGSDPVGNVYLLSARQQALEVAVAERDIRRYCSAGAAARLYQERRAAAAAPPSPKIEVERRR